MFACMLFLGPSTISMVLCIEIVVRIEIVKFKEIWKECFPTNMFPELHQSRFTPIPTKYESIYPIPRNFSEPQMPPKGASREGTVKILSYLVGKSTFKKQAFGKKT